MNQDGTPGSRPGDEIPLERIEAEISGLAGHLNAATYRLLVLIAEYDRRRGWASGGFRSCAEWLSWRAAMGAATAREHVRVARCLGDLPLVSGAFSKGELSFSQVRAITRVATAANEADLVMIARHCPAAQLETLCRSYRRVKQSDGTEAVNLRHGARYLHYATDDYGMVVIRARLDPEDGAVVIKALEAAKDALFEAERAENVSAEARGDVSAEARASEAQDVSAEARGDASGQAPREPRATLALNADALVALAETTLAAGPRARSGGDRYEVTVTVDAETLCLDRDDGRCELAGTPLHPETARRLGCDSSLVTVLERDGDPLSVGRKTRSLSSAIRRALYARDKTCRFPGCCRTRFTEAHHIVHWVKGGKTKLRNLALLCRFHHRLVHEGGYRIEVTGAGEFRFIRPDGSVLEPVPAPTPLGDTDLETLNRDLGLDIDPETCVSDWDGYPLDYVYAVGVLCDRDDWRSRHPEDGAAAA